MNKVTRILLAIGLILAVATPALAEFKFNGYYRLMGYVEEKKAVEGDGDSQQFIDQRFRGKATYTLNDNVALVYYFEVDTTWGELGRASTGGGFGGKSYSWAGGADGVNVETKNVYLDLKMGDTAAVLGIQTVVDSFEGIVAFDDMAAAKVTQKFGNTTLMGVYSKWEEGTTPPASSTSASGNRSDWDDFDYYIVEAKHKFSDNFTAGIAAHYMDNNNDATDYEIWFYGANAEAKFGDFGIKGFVMMQDGENKTGDYDISGWAATAKATMKIASGDVGLRVIYFPEADDNSDDERWQGFKGQYDFVGENQMQFLTDPFVCNDGKERYAIRDAVGEGGGYAGGGFGLMAFVLQGNHKLPEDIYLKWGAGYYMAADDTANVRGVKTEREDEELGYELALRIGKKFLEKVDLSLNASYADYGDFYETESGDTPDGTYKTYVMVNVPF